MKKLLMLLGLGVAAYEIYYHHIKNDDMSGDLEDAKGKIKEKWGGAKEKVKEKMIKMIDEM